MGRKAIEVATLHGYTLEDLVALRNTHESKYARIILTVIIMKYNKSSNQDIIEATQKSGVTIVDYVKRWNKLGIKCLEDHRGGSEPTFTAEMEDDLIYTMLNRTPNECGFVGHSWTCSLLAKYIENVYGEKYSDEWIRIVLDRRRMSYKKAQPKSTKANPEEQEQFKKNVRNARYFRVFF